MKEKFCLNCNNKIVIIFDGSQASIAACKRKYCTRTFDLIIDEKSRHYAPDFYHEDMNEYVETKGDRKDGLYNSNLICLQKIKDDGYNITLLKMSSFYEMLKTHDLYEKIPNLENRDYSGTKYLISN